MPHFSPLILVLCFVAGMALYGYVRRESYAISDVPIRPAIQNDYQVEARNVLMGVTLSDERQAIADQVVTAINKVYAAGYVDGGNGHKEVSALMAERLGILEKLVKDQNKEDVDKFIDHSDIEYARLSGIVAEPQPVQKALPPVSDRKVGMYYGSNAHQQSVIVADGLEYTYKPHKIPAQTVGQMDRAVVRAKQQMYGRRYCELCQISLLNSEHFVCAACKW